MEVSMIDTRILNNMAEETMKLLVKASHAANYDKDLAFHLIDRAEKVVQEFRREVYMSDRRSGEAFAMINEISTGLNNE
jgi:hypothetical protein